MTRDVLEIFEFSNARELLQAISPRGPWFGDEPNPSPWIYRGHAHSCWPLLPSALRPEKRAELHEIARTPQVVRQQMGTNIAQAIAEVALLYEFEKEVDRCGLPLPTTVPTISETLNQLYSFWRKTKDGQGSYWPLHAYSQIMSLAQHYRLPTRLLDWTLSPYVAAYFAADPAKLETGDCSEFACVWALNSTGMQRGISMRGAPNVRTVSVPRNANPNFHAQNGIFTLQGPDGLNSPLWDPISLHPLETSLLNYNDSSEFSTTHCFLRQFTFPRSTAGEVLWLLEKEGVTAASLFPGYAGAATAVRERRFSQRDRE